MDEAKAKEFLEAYQKLCNEMRFQIVSFPEFIARDDNTYSLVVRTAVKEMPEVKG